MNIFALILAFIAGFIVSLLLTRRAIKVGAGELSCCKDCKLKAVEVCENQVN